MKANKLEPEDCWGIGFSLAILSHTDEGLQAGTRGPVGGLDSTWPSWATLKADKLEPEDCRWIGFNLAILSHTDEGLQARTRGTVGRLDSSIVMY